MAGYAAAGLSRLGQAFNKWTTRITHSAGANNPQVKYPYRGNRAGVRLQRPIAPRITIREAQPSRRHGHSIDVNNLVTVPIEQGECVSDSGDLRKDNLKLLVLNAQSVVQKAAEVADFIVDQEADVCTLTETWLKSGEKDAIIRGQLTPDGYTLIDVP